MAQLRSFIIIHDLARDSYILHKVDYCSAFYRKLPLSRRRQAPPLHPKDFASPTVVIFY